MSRYVRALRDLGAGNVAVAGGKGAALGEMTRAELPVPRGFVVTTAAYRDFVEAHDLRDVPPEQLPKAIATHPVPEPMADAVESAYRELGGGAVAVRSSGTAEDLGEASFAGQHDTYLNVNGPGNVVAAVRDCWASLWTPRAVAYRHERGWDETGLALAVVVQAMVDAEWAGVMFTADPVTGRRDRLVVEAVAGLGESLVSGETTGVRVVVDTTSGSVVDGEGALPAELVAELTRLGAAVEQHFGGPMDVEWAYADRHCWLVQARPLTALPEAPATPSARLSKEQLRRAGRLPNLTLVADHAPYPPYPMDLSLYIRPAMSSILRALRWAGFAVPDVGDVLVEVDHGVVQFVPPRIRPTPLVLRRLPWSLPRLRHLTRSDPAAWYARYDATLRVLLERIEAEELSRLSEQELLARVEALRGMQAALTPSRFGAAGPRMIAYLLLRQLLRVRDGAETGDRLHVELLAGVPTLTREAQAGLRRLATTIRDSPALAQIYRESPPEEIAQRLGAAEDGRAFADDVEAYLRDFGYRQVTMPLPGFAPMRETPEVLHALLQGMAAQERAEGDDAARFARARTEMESSAGWRRVLARPALRLANAAREGVQVREDSHVLLFMLGSTVMRGLLLETGRRLVARGALAEADDVFFLEIDEVRSLPAEKYPALVETRRAARERVLPGYTVVPVELLRRAGHGDVGDALVTGTPASRGVATGPARVILDEAEFGRLRAGDVLVCRYTNPTWTPLFALASAVVTDTGGLASHAAIVAREYGIPAVMGTIDGTRLIADGRRIRVDGASGTVRHA